MSHQDDRIHHILDNLPALAAILDKEARYRFANRQHASWFGVNPDTLAGVHIRDVIGDDAFLTLQPCCERAITGNASDFSGEISFARGGQRSVYASCVALSAMEEEDQGCVLILTDVSELRHTQRALDASTTRSHTILDTAVDAIVTIDSSGMIQACNKATETLFGYAADDLIGQNVTVLMPGSYAAEHDGYLSRYLESGDKHIIGIGRDVTARKSDGGEFPARLAVGEFVERGRHYFTGFIRDVTAQKEAEQAARAHLDELSHLTRLGAIESLASGITHEINQPLTAIVTMSQALLRMQHAGRSDPAMAADVLDRIVNQCVRVNSIVQQMRSLARKSRSDDRSLHSIDEIIKDVLEMLDYEVVQHDIKVHTDFKADGLPVMVNRIQIEQVILNLVQNAVHALTGVEGDRNIAIESGADGDDNALITVTVTDNGVGLPDAGSGDIFDPFFTTREQGMGQGLSISRSIVETHGGKIDGNDNPAGGATFRFTLPAHNVADA